MSPTFRKLEKNGLLLGAALAAALAAPALAKEIDTDAVTLSAGTVEARASYVPWSGVWWPFADTELAKGWNGSAPDFEYVESTKKWQLTSAGSSKPVNDRSPLRKYDEYVRLTTGADPQSALLECQGDDAKDFQHDVYGDQKKKYDDDGVSYSWWGHCNGWCGAALLEKEPVAPIERQGIRFEVADLKGLLSESFWGVESDFTGARYNAPPKNIKETYEPGKALKTALDAGTPKPVAEYIAWYEKAWGTTMSAAAKAAAKPADFQDKLNTYYDWYKRTYDDAFADVAPDVWHKILATVIGRKKLAFVADIVANEEVWNHPAFAYKSVTTFKRDFTDAGTAKKEWTVATTVWYATDGVSESILGTSDFTKDYTYTLVSDASGKILSGTWTGASVNEHPDFAWLPTHNPTGVDYGENYKLLYGKLLEIAPTAHAQTEARAFDLNANGTSAGSRRGFEQATTWDMPVVAAGDVALTVAVASGRTVSKVAYFEEETSGGTHPSATRAALTSLGESSTAPGFAVTARFSSGGKKMVVAYAYSGAALVGIDEITLQYSVQGGGSTVADDTMEENDTKATAKAVAAGTYASLVCNDDDWFAITLAQAGSIDVGVAFQHSEGDLDATLEGPSGQVAKSDGSGNGETLAGANLAAGTYYVRVYGYNGAKAKYSMTVAVTGGPGPVTTNDDRYEPNNDRASASAVAAGSYPGLQCNDDDFFKVTLAAAGNLTVKIDFTNASGDLDLTLEGAGGTQIGKSDSTADTEQVAKTGLAAGTYFVRVAGYNGAKAPYALTITTSAPTTPTQRTGVVTASALNVRTGPSATSPIARAISRGTVVTILGESGSYYKVTFAGAPGGNLYCWKSYVRLNP